MTERQIELVWRCSSCRHQNLGRHTLCQGCGNPKDDSEEYEMPADPSVVASVTDPALLRLATAGANWSCAFCASQQRALDGSCGRCGAGRKEPPDAGPRAFPATARAAPARRVPVAALAVLGGILVVALFVTCGFVASRRRPVTTAATALTVSPPAPPRTDFEATVVGVSWRRTVTVEKWQLVAHEGFTEAVPQGAVEIRAAGQRVHHHEDVFDHDETVFDEVDVPDGFRTESYSERVACGQDCKTTPRTCNKVCTRTPRVCRQNCTNNKNGFASCREECTGGSETCRDDCTGGNTSCTPKFCDERRTRQIPKTRREKRPRIEKRYRSEPRNAPWSTYKTFEWVRASGEELSGEDLSPRWPDAGVAEHDSGPGSAPKLGDTRVLRAETLSVTFRLEDGSGGTREYGPTSEELPTLAPGTKHDVRVVAGRVTLLSGERSGDR